MLAFLLTGRVMGHHRPKMQFLTPDVGMMYVSGHIYLRGAALVNLTLGLYPHQHLPGWRRTPQQIGSLLILLSAVSSLLAFMAEPALGMAGRSWRSYFGVIGLFAGVMTHAVAGFARRPN